jgi:hypothetical protein
MEALEGAGLGLPPGGYVHCSEASRFRPGSKRPMTMKMNQWSNAVNRWGAVCGLIDAWPGEGEAWHMCLVCCAPG